MNIPKRATLAFSLLALLQAPVPVLAEEAPKLESSPATAAAPAPLDDMQSMGEKRQDMMASPGMGPGGKCNKRGGPGAMQGVGPGKGPGMTGMGPGMGMGAGMGPMGQDCDRRDGKGPGMMGMGQGGMGRMGMGRKCHPVGDGDACGCEHADALEKRLDEMEKRLDMMQMMLKMMMK